LKSKPISGITRESQQISVISYKPSQLSIGIKAKNSQPKSGKYTCSQFYCRAIPEITAVLDSGNILQSINSKTLSSDTIFSLESIQSQVQIEAKLS